MLEKMPVQVQAETLIPLIVLAALTILVFPEKPAHWRFVAIGAAIAVAYLAKYSGEWFQGVGFVTLGVEQAVMVCLGWMDRESVLAFLRAAVEFGMRKVSSFIPANGSGSVTPGATSEERRSWSLPADQIPQLKSEGEKKP